jgi:serine phosphatase RsbU (regulator of sigma subunit)
VVVVALLATAALTLVSYTMYSNNEKRLLDLRVKELGSVLAAAVPNTQTPLASAAALADATDGNARKFKRFVAPYVGAGPGHQFVSVSLWRLGPTPQGPLAVVGERPRLSAEPADAKAFFRQASRTRQLSVTGLRTPVLSGLGYAFTTPEATSHFAAYGESALPANRRSRLQGNSAFSDLDYAIYLGDSAQAPNLLVTSLKTLPVRGRQAHETIPFADKPLLLVVSSRRPLGGTFPQHLPWIIVIVGIILTLGAGGLTVRLIERRRAAERLSERLEHAVDENQRLYAEQRNIAQTLQHALLPEVLPQIPGTEASARFEPGEQGVEIGGDWYDVIPLDDKRLLLVVGDVTGRGLRAAATMASLRYAILAYAAQGDPPAMILSKLSRLLDVGSSGQLATVLCALIDIGEGTLSVTSAGHLPPLLISNGASRYVESEVGLPIGVQHGAAYQSTTISTPPSATILAFTDGLVERRGENLDLSLARLREAASGNHVGLPELLGRLITQLRHGPYEDDTAIVGVRWSE